MAKLPRFTAETPPPRETGLVRAQDIGALTRTGDIAVWRGVSQVGRAMMGAAGLGFDAYQRRKRLDDIIQWGRATQKRQEIISEKQYEVERTDFKMDMPQPGDLDYEETLVEFSTQKRDELIKAAMKDIDERVKKIPLGFSSRQKAEEFKIEWAQTRAQAENRIRHTIDVKHDSFQRAAMTKLSEDAARNGDIETANHYIDIMDKTELITPELAAVKKGQVEQIAAKAILDFAKMQIETEVRQLAVAEGWESSYRHILDPKNQQEWAKIYGISLEEIKGIAVDIKTMFDGERTLANEALEQQREIDRGEIYDAIDAGKPPDEFEGDMRDFIESTSLDEDEQERKLVLFRKELDRKLAGEDIITNWQIYNELDNEVKSYQLAPTPKVKADLLDRLAIERFDNKNIAQTEYQKLKDSLEKELSSEDTYWLREARSLLDESIRERDPLSGMLKTEEGLIAAAAMAKMTLDKAMEEAAVEDKPIRGRDILIRAMQMAPMFKIPEEKWEKWPLPTTISRGVEETRLTWGEPLTLDGFYETIKEINQTQGDDAARAYYEEWVEKFTE